ncbi:alpha/beta hydrolase [Biformimicrobium ophioploci]|uniref:alpha/beta hydrolase n=1 Tax=Biformimicrobium ophioploci TaxID=3036711 RepID=UPI00255760AA|nr:alpha/beta hydrolase [Microbulbifer sp. NKW57]
MHFSSRGHQLFYRHWLPESPQAILVVCHGLGEHSGRYADAAAALNTRGIGVYAFDLYGHGESPGQRGDIEGFAAYAEDLAAFVRVVGGRHPEVSLHLLGHSMGGMIATAYGVRSRSARAARVASIILSAPGYRGATEPGSLEKRVIGWLAGVVPWLRVSNRLDDALICRNSRVVEAYRKDPLVHDKVSLRWFTSYQQERAFTLARLSQLKLPVLLLVAESDGLVDAAETIRCFEQIGSACKEMIVYPQAYHEILNEEREGPAALDAVVAHIQTRRVASVD